MNKDDLADEGDVNKYIFANRFYFPTKKIMYLKSKLMQVNKKKFEIIEITDLKSPGLIGLISVFLGTFGIDRFMIGDIWIGILKLLTCGLCGILWIYDVFVISDRVRERNFEKIILMM